MSVIREIKGRQILDSRGDSMAEANSGASEHCKRKKSFSLTVLTVLMGLISVVFSEAVYAQYGENRLKNIQYADGSTLTFTYDTVGNVTDVTDSLYGTIEFAYDKLDRVIQEITPLAAITYQYDAIGRRTSMTVGGMPPVTYTYDAASRLTKVAQGPLFVNIGYDASGRRTSLTYSNGTSTTYTYNAASRLTGITHTRGTTTLESVAYSYDPAGNRISVVRSGGIGSSLPTSLLATYDPANQLVQVNSGSLNLIFDANGNLTSQTEATGTTTYTWDARNRLVAIAGLGLSASFGYDPFGRRVSKTINGVTTQYIYDGDDIITEISNGAIGATYLRSLDVDEPFVRHSTIDEFYHADALGTTLALTDSTGSVRTTYNYDPFGATTVSGTSSTNPFQFVGRENDGTGLYNYRARYYSPKLHRFVSEDPIEFEGGDVNLYAYTFNNPVNYTDPSGEIVPLLLFCARGSLTNIAIDVLSGRKPELANAISGCIPGFGQLSRVLKVAKGGKFISAGEIAKRLGASKEVFHRSVKPAIQRDFSAELKKAGIRNPDIGVDKAGNIILRDPKTGRTLETNVPLSSFSPTP